MDERLVQRLLGAVAVFGLIFVLSLLLPAPGEVDEQPQAQGVTLDLRRPPTRTEPPGPESEGASEVAAEVVAEGVAVDAPQAAKAIEDRPPAAPPSATKPKPEPAPVEKPPVPQTPAPVAGGRYWVQVVALSDWERAHALSNTLESLGYRGTIQPSESAGKPIFRVRVGAYGTRDEAAAAQRALAGSGYGQTAIVSGE